MDVSEESISSISFCFFAYFLLIACPTYLSSLNMEAEKILRNVSKLPNYTTSGVQNHCCADLKIEKRVLWGTFGRMGEEVTGGCVKFGY
jgi:hypothetical protein